MNDKKTAPFPQNISIFILCSCQVWKNGCVCVSGVGANGLQGEVSLLKVNWWVMINLEMLFTCLSITNPNKVMSQIKYSIAATQGRFGNPGFAVSHQAALLSFLLSGTNYQISGTGIFWVDVNHYTFGRVQARVATNCHHITSLHPAK